MTNNMLNAIARAVTMHRNSGYRLDEALSFVTCDYALDEFEAEDLEVLVRNQLARLQLQTGY